MAAVAASKLPPGRTRSCVAALAPSTRLSVSVGLTLPGGFTRSDSVARWRERPQALPGDVPAVFCLLAG